MTSIWQTCQTVSLSHLHLSHGVMNLGLVVHALMSSQHALPHLQILLMKVHCHGDSLASSRDYTSPLICSKSIHGIHTYQHIPTWSYLLWCLKWVFMLETYGCLFCCYGKDLSGIFCLLCYWLMPKFVVTITLGFTLQMGSSTTVTWSYLLYGFDFMDIWHI